MENLAAFLLPTPLTRVIRSDQSLKGDFLRSSMMRVDMPGPMPLTLSNSAADAVLASTAANDMAA